MAWNPRHFRLIEAVLDGQIQVWEYDTTDAIAVCAGPGYFADAASRGARTGDRIWVRSVDALPVFTRVVEHAALTIQSMTAIGAATAGFQTPLPERSAFAGEMIPVARYRGSTVWPVGLAKTRGTGLAKDRLLRFELLEPTHAMLPFGNPDGKAATISIASPAVVTCVGHGLLEGAQVVLASTDALPTGLDDETRYYVLASGLTADTVQLSATPGGAAINTSGTQSGTHRLISGARPVTISIASPGTVTAVGRHGLLANDRVQFKTTGALPTGLVAGTTYYVSSSNLTGASFRLSATPGGATIDTSGTQSGTHTMLGPVQRQNMTRLDMLLSEDNGRTWYDRRTIFASDRYRPVVAAIGNMANGRVGGIVAATPNRWEAINRLMFFVWSDDYGVTWSQRLVTEVSASHFPYGMLMPLPAAYQGHDTLGFLVGTYGGTNTGKGLETQDNGETWSEHDYIVSSSGLPIVQEPSYVFTRSGVVALLRGAPNGNLFASRSADMRTWSTPVDTGLPLGSNPVLAVSDPDGTVTVSICYRDEFSGSVEDNIMATWVIDGAALYADPTRLAVAQRRIEWNLPDRGIGYLYSIHDGSQRLTLLKAESGSSTSLSANCSLHLLTSRPSVVGATWSDAPSEQLLDNPAFTLWDEGELFENVVSDRIIANRMRVQLSGATLLKGERVALSEELRSALPWRPAYAMLLDTTGDDDNFFGLYQWFWGPRARRLIERLLTRGEVTGVFGGYMQPIQGAQFSVTMNFGTGGSVAVSSAVNLPAAYATEKGAWMTSGRLVLPQVGVPTWGPSPRVQIGISNGATVSNVKTMLAGMFAFDGPPPSEPIPWDEVVNRQRCDRYCQVVEGETMLNKRLWPGHFTGATAFRASVPLRPMDMAPLTTPLISDPAHFQASNSGTFAITALAASAPHEQGITLTGTVSGATANQPADLEAINAAARLVFPTGY